MGICSHSKDVQAPTDFNIIFDEARLEPMPETRHGFPVMILLHADENPHGELQLATDLFKFGPHLFLLFDVSIQAILVGNHNKSISMKKPASVNACVL